MHIIQNMTKGKLMNKGQFLKKYVIDIDVELEL